MAESLRIAWFSDLKKKGLNSNSLSSYISRLLLPLLSKDFDLELFSSEEGVFALHPVRHFLTAFRRHAEKPFDIFFYQFEDSQDAFFVRAHLGLCPGVVWFHDFFLTNDGPEPLLNSPWEETVEKYNNPDRPWPARDREYQRPKPQAYREAGLSLLPLFSSERDHAEYRRLAKTCLRVEEQRSYYLPVPVEKAVCDKGVNHGLRILFCGSPRIEHRAHKVLQAIRDAHAAWTLVWLVDGEESARAQELLAEFGPIEAELSAPRTPERFMALLAGVQLSVHAHFSVYGHVFPYLPLSLAAGVPCVVSDFASNALLPDNIVFKIEAGETEARQLTMLLNRLETIEGRERVHAASAYAVETHDPVAIASELRGIFKSNAAKLARAMSRWRQLERDARHALLQEALEAEEENCLKPSFEELAWLDEREL